MPEGSMGATRGKRARHALVVALGLVLLEFIVFAGTNGIAWDPLSILVNFAVSLAIAFPLGYLLLVTDEKIWKWRRRRHPLPLPPAAGTVESFHWTGRPARTNVRRTGALIAFFAIAIVLLLLPAPGAGALQALRSVLIGVFVVFVGLFALGTAFMMRPMTFEVDERGVRIHGISRASFSRQWQEIHRIEFVSMEKVFPFAFPAGNSGPRMTPMRMYAFLDSAGKVIGHLQPQGFLGDDLSNQLEAALGTNASRHGIPIVEVRWRDSMRWRKRKVTREAETRVT